MPKRKTKVWDTKLKMGERKLLAKIVARASNRAVAEAIGVAPRTLLTINNGMTGHRGTVAQIRKYLVDQPRTLDEVMGAAVRARL